MALQIEMAEMDEEHSPANFEVCSYWSRQFKKHMEKKRASRMTAIPQLTIPHILVDDDLDIQENNQRNDTDLTTQPRWTQLSAGEGLGQQLISTQTDLSLHDTAYHHPLNHPRSSETAASRQGSTSGFSFELYEPESQSQDVSPGNRRGSAVSPTETRDMLDDSVWMESIRRSATLRRPDRGSYRFGDIG